MILTKEQIKQVEELATPLAQWLAINCHPHVTVILDSTRVEVVEGLMQSPLTKVVIPD